MGAELQHLLTCDKPDVHTHKGVTMIYTRCRNCGAEQFKKTTTPGSK